MAWLQTLIQFPARSRILEVSQRDSVGEKITQSWRDYSPEFMEGFLRLLIVGVRPELEGCTIWFMDFSAAKSCWEIGVDHPSFPAVAQCGEIPRENLFKEDAEHEPRCITDVLGAPIQQGWKASPMKAEQ